MLHLHNVLRWVILILLLLSILQAFAKYPGLKNTSLWLMIAAHIMLLLGITQWFIGETGYKLIQNSGFSAIMEDGKLRFFAIEHVAGMLISIILITIARGKAKRSHYKAASWLYVIALLLILATIPWPFREGIGRPWFPGM